MHHTRAQMQFFVGFALLLVTARAAPSLLTNPVSACRCLPSDACWPTSAEWNQFNNSVSGALQSLVPVAAACHDPTYDASRCAATNASYLDSSYRVTLPAALFQVNFETLPSKNESCYINSPRSQSCDQGSVPVYAVAVTTFAQIQAAINFVRKQNLRLVIKNTGHDFLGRSTAPGSLQIWTHQMQQISISDSFYPAGCSKDEGPAVTVGAGVLTQDLLSATLKKGRVVLGGAVGTIGYAGGYIQGGGHSPYSPWVGMASDYVLQFTLITAEGNYIAANACQNSDLFWALRGGGGGTYGVVDTVTVKTFEEPSLISVNVNVTITDKSGGAGNTFWDLVAEYHKLGPAWEDAGGSSYYFIFPDRSGLGPNLNSQHFLVGHDVSFANNFFKKFIQTANKVGIATAIATQLPKGTPPLLSSGTAGKQRVFGSRLISTDFLRSSSGPSRLVDVLKKINTGPSEGIHGHLVSGGGVAKNAGISSALNPAWRRAAAEVILVRTWSDDTSFEKQAEIQRNMSRVEMAMLKELEPDMGAYGNEGDPHEQDWQQNFYGSSYGRLLELKRKWDPAKVFRCRHCVGSEYYDDDGICLI